jgi:hypothetical protein
MKLKVLIGIGLSIAALGVAGVIIIQPWEILAVRANTQTVLSIANPEDNAVVPVHANIPVIAEVHSRSGIRELKLWVNDQLWGERSYADNPQVLQEIWGWTPSGDGLFHLRLQAINGFNETVDSDVTVVVATLAADIRFPYEFTSQGGETLEELAERFQTDPDAIAATNPTIDLSTVLMPDLDLIIPVPVPNGPLSGPESGLPPIQPRSPGSSPPPGAGEGSRAGSGEGGGEESPGNRDGDEGSPVSLSQVDLPIHPGFEINQGILLPNYPVDKLYLYMSIAGSSWQRLPPEDQTFLDPSQAGFDLKDHFPVPGQAEAFTPIPYLAQAWGWVGPQLIYLGEESGTFMQDLSGFPLLIMTQTRLDIIGRIRDDVEYVSEWTIPEPIPDYYQGLVQGFRWSSAIDGVTGGLYQVSLQPFTPSSGLLPPGLLLAKLVPGPKVVKQSSAFPGLPDEISIKPAKFSIDFGKFIELPEDDSKGNGFIDTLIDAINAASDTYQALVGNAQQLEIGTQQGLVLSTEPQFKWGPQTFYVRIIPIIDKKFDMEASNTVVVRYGPPQIEPISTELGGAYEVEVVSFTPYLPANSNYAACMVAKVDINICTSNVSEYQATGVLPDPVCQTYWPKGSLSCGCPGVQCDTSGGGCGWDPFCHLGNFLEAGANFVKDFVGEIVAVYNDFKDAVVGFVADLGCSALSGEANSVCKGLVNLGVNVALTSLGIPPEIPDFEKLMDEGLEYALETAVSQLTGCDETCQAAIKKGLEILADPEKALDEGLNVGIEFAKEQLEKQGIPCDSTCQGLMKSAVNGELDGGKVLDQAFEEAAQQAAQYIKDQGYECGSACESVIRAQLKNGADALNLGQTGLPKGQASSWWEPHPRALEQRAVLTLRVTRRPETAAVPDEHLEGCSLSIYNQASNMYLDQTISGKLFEGVGVGIPILEPGNALSIPIVLNRSPWHLPPSFSAQTPPGEIIAATLSEPFYGEWSALYFGSSATFDLSGNFFLTFDPSGSSIGLPCVEQNSWSSPMPSGQ